MTSLLSLTRPAYRHVNYGGVPIFRAHAWALEDARLHGQDFVVFSGDRRTNVIRDFNRKYGTHLHDQAYLYNGWIHRLPGFLPANPPDRGTHLLLGDGVVGKLHEPLQPYQLGIDIVSAGHVNDAGPLVDWLNAHGYRVTRPYHSGSEAHHILFLASPAINARRRAAATILPRQRTSSKGKDFLVREEGVVLHAYNDPAGHATFGVGHLIHLGPVNAADEREWGSTAHPKSRAFALRVLSSDLKKYEAAVRDAVGRRLPQHQFDACVSLCFNIGIGAFSGSSVASALRSASKSSRTRLAADAFLHWDRPSMLLPRRQRERRLFLFGKYT